jgi:pantoate--beta-alanine ligase
MIVLNTSKEVSAWIMSIKSKNQQIGFVPTMGALHEGHLSLLKRAKKENKATIISIFVNPTQFNDKKDLEKYPQNLLNDLELLKNLKVEVVFAPSVEEIYPDGMHKGQDIDLGGLDNFMEGAMRPGHFNGMAQVVNRLLEITKPDRLYMGQKDFQQFTIVHHFITNLKLPVQLIVCPIKRESNGLAMSSRNERLSPSARNEAKVIYKTLQFIKKNQNTKPIRVLIDEGFKKMSISGFEPEYLSIVDGKTLLPVTAISQSNYIVACTAVKVENVRLIDNIILKGSI